jgi:valyl-tRNA synthetase
VRKVFVDLHRQGLIYRDKRLVNWDPHFQTAISDLEVEQKEVDGAYWHFAYPLENGVTYEYPVAFDDDGKATEWETRDYIVVATTRPETMLGDTAVAVHPDDERYKGLVGKTVKLPIVGRSIPIVADDYADPTKGSGAVKITPAHDFNDFQVGKRHGLEAINILDAFGRINDNAPEAEYRGHDRFVARKMVIEAFEHLELLKGIEKTRHMVPHGDRSGVVIEPWLTDQWYVDAGPWPFPPSRRWRRGPRSSSPKLGQDLFRVDAEHPALVHQPPALVGPPDPGLVRRRTARSMSPRREVRVAEDAREAGAAVGRITRRTDPGRGRSRHLVLLGPVAVLDLGWPEKTADLERFYPTHDPGHRLRHHLLLGRPDDDDGPALHRSGPVPARGHQRPGARRVRGQDEQVQGQRHGPTGADRPATAATPCASP